MAAQGFNVCIIARSQAKMDEKLNEIKEKFKVETRAVVFDFNELCQI